MMNEKFSFLIGFGQVPTKDAKKVRGEIMKALNITARSTWLRRLNGEVEPTITEVERVEAVFKRYGIYSIWGKIE